MNIQDLTTKYNQLMSNCQHMQKQIKHLRKDVKERDQTISSLKKDMEIVKQNETIKKDFVIPVCPEIKPKKYKTRGLSLVTDWCVLEDCNQPECHHCFPVKGCERHRYCIDNGRFKEIPLEYATDSD